MSLIEPGTILFELDPEANRYVEWSVVDVIWRADGVSAILSRGDIRATADIDALETVVTDRANPAWVPSMCDGVDDDGQPEWVPHPRHADRDADPHGSSVELRVAPADSPGQLTFEKIEGPGSRTEVNRFLEGADDGLVFHALGGVSSWKAAFVARHDGDIVSALVLHHYHPSTNGEEIAITRLAHHTSAPPNTSTWMLSQARKWAERAGYQRLAAFSGVDGNDGTCYNIYGFERDGDPVVTDGTSWGDEDQDNETWVRQKWVYELDPDRYVGKCEQWAVETVVDGVTVPG